MTPKIRVLIVDDVPETRDNVRRLLEFEVDIEIVGEAGTGREAVALAKSLQPQIVLMDINMPDMDGITATRELTNQVPYSQIIIMSVQFETDYMRSAMLAGARDYQTKPFTGDELVRCIRRAYSSALGWYSQAQKSEMHQFDVQQTEVLFAHQNQDNVVAVYSPKGGVGKTLISVNLALRLKYLGQKVVIMDADLQFGRLPMFLGLNRNCHIVDLFIAGDEIDKDALRRYLLFHSSGVVVFPAPQHPEEAEQLTENRLRKILYELTHIFDMVLVDAPRELNANCQTVLDLASRVLLVVTPDSPTLDAVATTLNIMRELNYPVEKPMLILNQTRLNAKTSGESIAEQLKHSITAQIPFDDTTVSDSIDRGIPFVVGDPSKPISQSIFQLADQLLMAPSFQQSVVDARMSAAIESIEELQITDRLDTYERSPILGRALDNLEQAFAGIPHDLKEPLMVARNNLDELLLDSRMFKSPDSKTDLIISQKSIIRCKNILDYALMLVDQFITLVSCDEFEATSRSSLTSAIYSVIRFLTARFGDLAGLVAEIDPADVNIQMKDPQLRLLVSCMLENALEIAPAGRTIRLRTHNDLQECQIAIINEGVLIQDTGRPTLDLANPPAVDYFGLREFVGRKIITRYGGRLSVSMSDDGQDTVTLISLPTVSGKRRSNHDLPVLRRQFRKHRVQALTAHDLEIVRAIETQAMSILITSIAQAIANIECLLPTRDATRLYHGSTRTLALFRTIARNCAYAQAVIRSLAEPTEPDQIGLLCLKQAMQGVLELFETKLPAKSVAIKIGDEISILADPILFQRVFFNLTRNALEAMRRGGKFDLSVSAQIIGEYAVIEFVDSGIGISAENLPKLFTRGFSTKAKGRGLGLSMVKSIVEQHGGRIEVKSEIGSGTTFTLHWPVSQLKVAVPARILIIDDENEWLEILVRNLESTQYVTDTARSPTKARALLHANSYRLILLDWNLPGIGGVGLLKDYQKDNGKTPVIVLSAYMEPEQRVTAQQLGVIKVAEKPAADQDWKSLKQMVEDIVSGKPML